MLTIADEGGSAPPPSPPPLPSPSDVCCRKLNGINVTDVFETSPKKVWYWGYHPTPHQNLTPKETHFT